MSQVMISEKRNFKTYFFDVSSSKREGLFSSIIFHYMSVVARLCACV